MCPTLELERLQLKSQLQVCNVPLAAAEALRPAGSPSPYSPRIFPQLQSSPWRASQISPQPPATSGQGEEHVMGLGEKEVYDADQVLGWTEKRMSEQGLEQGAEGTAGPSKADRAAAR